MSEICPGSGVLIQPMTQAVLCYCGVTFKRKLKSLRQWSIPSHSPNMITNTTAGIYNISHRSSLSRDIIEEKPQCPSQR